MTGKSSNTDKVRCRGCGQLVPLHYLRMDGLCQDCFVPTGTGHGTIGSVVNMNRFAASARRGINYQHNEGPTQ